MRQAFEKRRYAGSTGFKELLNLNDPFRCHWHVSKGSARRRERQMSMKKAAA